MFLLLLVFLSSLLFSPMSFSLWWLLPHPLPLFLSFLCPFISLLFLSICLLVYLCCGVALVFFLSPLTVFFCFYRLSPIVSLFRFFFFSFLLNLTPAHSRFLNSPFPLTLSFHQKSYLNIFSPFSPFLTSPSSFFAPVRLPVFVSNHTFVFRPVSAVLTRHFTFWFFPSFSPHLSPFCSFFLR